VIPRRKKKISRRVKTDFPIDVLGSGAILLGPRVTCDGFHADRTIRVQTHIHSDHMTDFTTSLRGEVVMTKATRRLLEMEHPSLTSRPHVRALEYGEEWEHEGNRIQMFSSDHALGAAQVKVTLKNGSTVGYSGDFNWPLNDVIKVDALVVDATYGNPASQASCPQEKVQEALVDLVRRKLRHGPVHMMADTGPAERAMLVLAMADIVEDIPVIGNKRTCWYAQVNGEYRRPMPNMLCDELKQAHAAMRDGPYLRVWSLHSRLPNDGLYEGVVIRLTKYRTTVEPVEQVGDDVFHIGFSNHADFTGTVEYVEATGASFVVTDNLRGQKNERAEQLARMLRTQLGICARVSSNTESREWGR
jgi:putative mRNA 3-end processing factor